jgi:formate dehydrogenase major subunit
MDWEKLPPGRGAGLQSRRAGLLAHGGSGRTRSFKLARTTETRSICPYCSVSCGLIIYTLGDKAKNVKSIVHIEGDPDNPVNRGTLCPKGAGVMDMIQSPTASPSRGARARQQRMEAHQLGRSPHARGQAHEGRPRRQLHRQERQGRDGQPLEHHRFPDLFSASNESGYLSVKIARGLGIVTLDTQARI